MTAPPVVRGPVDLPDWRLWLLDQWSTHGPFTLAQEAMNELQRRRAAGTVAEHLVRSHDVWEREAIQRAALWWVSEDMVALWQHAAQSMPEDTSLDVEALPDRYGLAVLEAPLWGQDALNKGHQVRIDAVLWGTVNLPPLEAGGRLVPCQAVGISIYTRQEADDGLDPYDLERATLAGAVPQAKVTPLGMDSATALEAEGECMGHLEGDVLEATGVSDVGALLDRQASIHGLGMPEQVYLEDGGLPVLADTDVADEYVRRGLRTDTLVGRYPDGTIHPTAYRLSGTLWFPLGRSDWPLGEPLGEPILEGLPAHTMESMAEDRRLLATLWLLATQPGVTAAATRDVGRPARRRSERRQCSSRVHVVRLRTLPNADPEHGHGERRAADHRWIVSGHWRQQPYGPGRSLRRPVWIAPHVKGPDGAPLVVRDTVKAWVR